MVKIPLALNLRPRIMRGATSMLEKGLWVFEHNISDSDVKVVIDNDPQNDISDPVNIEKDSRVYIEILRPGTEDQLTIYAVQY